MKKKKKPKPKPRKQTAGPPVPPPPPGSGGSSPWERFFFFGKILGAVVAIGGFASLVLGWWEAVHPTIAPLRPDPKKPFELPFTVRNSSWLSLQDVRWSCIAIRLELPNDNVITNTALIQLGTSTIGPRSAEHYRCRMSNVSADQVKRAELVGQVTYSVLGIGLTKKVPFTWEAGQWVAGEIH